MQPAQEDLQPAQPHPAWVWHERSKRWHAPGTSPFNGVAPPLASRFKTGDPRAVELGSKAGIISAKARAKLQADEAAIDKIVARWIRDAQRGDNRAREQLLDRLEGKVEQSIHATVESRYVIEEAGCAYVDAAPTLTVTASDNMHYVSGCTDESGRAPMEGEPKSGGGGADPDGGIASPTAEHVHVWKVMHPETGQSSCTVAGCEYMFIPSVPLGSLPPAKILEPEE